MPSYGIPQAGSNPTPALNVVSLEPGQSMYLWNNESPAAATSSVAFCRAPAPGSIGPSMIVFTVSWAVASPVATVAIQGSNVDIDAEYNKNVLQTVSGNGFYSDLGGFKFYRAQVVTYSSGAPLTVIAQR